VMVVANKIRNALQKPFILGNHTVAISSSIGIALFPEHGTSDTVLLQNADSAMYVAKESGRNRVHVFQDALDAA